MACRSLDFGPTGFDLVACGCSSNAQFDRFSATARNYGKGVSVSRSCSSSSSSSSRRYAAKRSVYCQRGIGIGPCRVFSTRAPHPLLHGTIYCFSLLDFWLIFLFFLFFFISILFLIFGFDFLVIAAFVFAFNHT